MYETALGKEIQLEAARRGMTLLRNNCGAAKDETGRLIRYGLGHTAPNQKIRSVDYVGWQPVIITPAMVGRTLAVITAAEVKLPGWRGPTDDRERAQERFISLVNRAGGRACFISDVKALSDLMTF